MKKLKIKYFLYIFIIAITGYLIFSNFNLRGQKKDKNISEDQPKIQKVKIAMGYIPNIQFAPFYLALNKGYFDQENLEIEFNYGFEADIIQLLAKNELQFGIGSGEQVILARSQNLPIISFFNWYQRFPVCLTSLVEKEITKPADLVGKTVGIPAVQGASYIGFQALLKKNNLDEKQVNLKVIGYTQTASLIENKVDVAVCYQMNEPLELLESGYQVNNIEIANYANLVSNCLLTNEKTIEKNPQLVQGFSRAFLKGLKDTINNPEQAFTISKNFIPEMKNEEIQKKVLEESIKFWQGDKLGWNKKEQWGESVDLLKEFNLIEEKLKLENLFTNQFLN